MEVLTHGSYSGRINVCSGLGREDSLYRDECSARMHGT